MINLKMKDLWIHFRVKILSKILLKVIYGEMKEKLVVDTWKKYLLKNFELKLILYKKKIFYKD